MFLLHLLFNFLFSLYFRKLCLLWQSCLYGCQLTCFFSCSKILSYISKVILPFLAYIWHRLLPGWIFTRSLRHRHCHHHHSIQRGFLFQEYDIHSFVPGPCLASLGHMLLPSCSRDLVKEIQNKSRNNHCWCISLFPGRILWKSCQLGFKSTQDSPSPFQHLKSDVWNVSTLAINESARCSEFPPLPQKYTSLVLNLFIFEESLSSIADVFRNRMT